MGRLAEQLTRLTPQSMRRQAKRDAKRARRRAEKRDPEMAPLTLRHVLKGWAD